MERYFFCACGSQIKMFSVTTGEQTRVLQAHESNVVGIAINPQNPLQLYSFGKDKRILLWDYHDAVVLSTTKTSIVIESFEFDPIRSGVVYLSAFGSRKKRGAVLPSYDIYEFRLENTTQQAVSDSTMDTGRTSKMDRKASSKNMQGKLNLLFQSKARTRSSFLVTPDGQYLVVQSKRHWKILHIPTNTVKKFNNRSNISCIAVHPKQHFIATGGDTGEITFWYIFGESSDSGVKNTKKMVNGNRSRSRSKVPEKQLSEKQASDSDDDTLPSEAENADSALWENSNSYGYIRDDPVTTTIHWHAHKVGAISFDSTGTHMLSGGQEMVLVIWQIESGRKDFLPRLGAPILGLTHTPDETLLSIRCSDNSVKIINARSRLLQVCVEGINLETPYFDLSTLSQDVHTAQAALNRFRRAQRLKTGLVVEPRNYSVVFHATEGQLQFYNAFEDRNVMKVQVGTKNPVKTAHGARMEETIVNRIAFSSNGMWMVTVDSRNDQLAQSFLKFWYWDQQNQQYELNTQYNISKMDKIRSIAYHPSKDFCVTVGTDGKYKIWKVTTVKLDELEENSNQANTGSSSNVHPSHNPKKHQKSRVELNDSSVNHRWFVDSSGAFRGLQPRCVCYSPDGSVLAISYGHIITLWNPSANMLLSTLTYPPDSEAITKMAFLSDSHYLVACSTRRLFVWDLLTCSIAWSHIVEIALLVVDSKSPRFAAYSPSSLINPESIMAKHTVQDNSSTMQIDVSASSEKAAKPTSSKQKIKTDGYVFLFDPSTPAPQGYWVMPTHGLRGLAFLPRPKATNPQQSQNPVHSSLLYLNGDHELKFLLTNTADGETHPSPNSSGRHSSNAQSIQQQFLAKINATKLAEGTSIFALMYGSGETSELNSAPQVPSEESTSTPIKTTMLPKIQSSKKATATGGSANTDPGAQLASQLTERFIKELSKVDSHILRPPSAMFSEFSDALIIKSSSSTTAESAPNPNNASNAATPLSGKAEDSKFVVPKKLAAARLAHAEVLVEAKLLDTELQKLTLAAPQVGTEFEFLSDFLSSLSTNKTTSRFGEDMDTTTLFKNKFNTDDSMKATSPNQNLERQNSKSPKPAQQDSPTDSLNGTPQSKPGKKRKRSHSNASAEGMEL